jgi:hypothetical protein
VHWPLLLPSQGALQAHTYNPHLLTVLLYDPVLKVRAAAATTLATMLEGAANRQVNPPALGVNRPGQLGKSSCPLGESTCPLGESTWPLSESTQSTG